MDLLHFLLLSIELVFRIFPALSSAADSIRPPQFLSDGQTLISKEGSFELGFFSPGSSKFRYVGIWYKTIPVRTIVWVANRENPIQDTHGFLMINSARGSLQILNGNHTLLWSSNSTKATQKPVAQLLDSGNLVLRDEKEKDSESLLWQSFDYPSDTLLPGMKLGWDLRTHFRLHLTTWKSSNDPSPGELSYGIELHRYPEAVMWKGTDEYYRSGPWNGLQYSGEPQVRPGSPELFEFLVSNDGIYYTYQLKNRSVLSRFVVNQTSSSGAAGQLYVWCEAESAWKLLSSMPRDMCDKYNPCGEYGVCFIGESPVCECLNGFKPKSLDLSQGCVRSWPFNCSSQFGFSKFDVLKFPDTTHTWVKSMNLEECRAKCLANCSCSAFTNSDVRNGGSGCAIWFGDLIDMRQLQTGEQELYIRVPASESGTSNSAKKIAVIASATIALVCGMLIVCVYACRNRTIVREDAENKEKDYHDEEQEGAPALPLFGLAAICNATDNFSDNSKLGEDGFGSVYKGTLSDGQEIAVKRLSRSSEQGSEEFKNEVTLIAKLQHRNLVKLLGCCIAGEDKMLIYEYMPNKSLDFFIFDPVRAKVLDWPKRFQIICGIARGFLYLHQDSRLRIIRRDLKASNVLLDYKMGPKISDFGLARSFENDHETMANTTKVVGTYGYMAPEYAIDGLFSIKSDVFSFGVLLLEIVSGKKNRGFCHRNHGLNLSGHAWRLLKEGRCLELVDKSYGGSNSASEIVGCIRIGLLCVQEQLGDRPTMSSVILMLASEIPLAEPKHPGFFVDRNLFEEEESSSSTKKSSSINEVTLSVLESR